MDIENEKTQIDIVPFAESDIEDCPPTLRNLIYSDQLLPESVKFYKGNTNDCSKVS